MGKKEGEKRAKSCGREEKGGGGRESREERERRVRVFLKKVGGGIRGGRNCVIEVFWLQEGDKRDRPQQGEGGCMAGKHASAWDGHPAHGF